MARLTLQDAIAQMERDNQRLATNEGAEFNIHSGENGAMLIPGIAYDKVTTNNSGESPVRTAEYHLADNGYIQKAQAPLTYYADKLGVPKEHIWEMFYGPGHDDPTGQYYIQDTPGQKGQYQDQIAAGIKGLNGPRGVMKYVDGWVDNGGIVKAAIGALGGYAYGGGATGYADAASNLGSTPYYGVGEENLLDPSMLEGGLDSPWGVNIRTPYYGVGEESLLDPSLMPNGGAGTPFAPDVPFDAGSSLMPKSTFDLSKFDPTKLTTGNKLVDGLLSKAGTTALGALNQNSAGEGGDTGAATAQEGEEARKQALLEQINALYDQNNYAEDEKAIADALRASGTDTLKTGYSKAERTSRFDAARRGNIGGSAMADNLALLNRDNETGATRIEDEVQKALASLRGNRLQSQNQAISLVNAGSGAEAVDAASRGIKNSIDAARATKIPDVTAGLFQNLGLSSMGEATAGNNAALNAYIQGRTQGGGSLFPLGSRAGGYSIAT